MQNHSSIDQFYKTAIQMLSVPASGASKPLPLFAVADTPQLLVYVGAKADLAGLREQLPDSTFLLGLHDEADSGAVSCGGRTLTSIIGEKTDCCSRAGLLTSLLPEKRVRLIVSEAYEGRFDAKVERIGNSIQSAIENATNDERRGLIRLRAAFCNLKKMLSAPFLHPAVLEQDVPAVLCGAGPSLADNLEPLKQLQHRAVIVAVGHAVKTLRAAGITPHVIVEGDALAGRNWPEGLTSDSLLVCTSEVAPEVATRFDQIIWCAGSSLPFNALARQYELPLFPVILDRTVSVHALDYMRRAGFRRIAFVGQDYALSRSGQLYADPSKKASDKDESVFLPAADGSGQVRSNSVLASLRKGISSYLESSFGAQLEILNASGGASLPRTTSGTLEEWSVGFEPLPQLEFTKEVEFFNGEVLDEMAAELDAALVQIDAVLTECKSIGRELARYPLRVEAIRKKWAALKEAMESEQKTRADSPVSSGLDALFADVDRLLKKTPGMLSDSEDPEKQLCYLTRRYMNAGRMYSDLSGILMKSEGLYQYSAYYEENLAAVARHNPNLEQKLRTSALCADEFEIQWFNQILPYVKRRIDDEWVELSSQASFFQEAADVVEQFVQEADFDPNRDALTILAPGNWVYVLQFLRRYPQLHLAVIDPWPALLQQLISRGSFLNQLPPDVPLVETWADPLYMKIRGAWGRQGLRKKLFVSPHVKNMPDVAVLAKNLQVLP